MSSEKRSLFPDGGGDGGVPLPMQKSTCTKRNLGRKKEGKKEKKDRRERI